MCVSVCAPPLRARCEEGQPPSNATGVYNRTRLKSTADRAARSELVAKHRTEINDRLRISLSPCSLPHKHLKSCFHYNTLLRKMTDRHARARNSVGTWRTEQVGWRSNIQPHSLMSKDQQPSATKPHGQIRSSACVLVLLNETPHKAQYLQHHLLNEQATVIL